MATFDWKSIRASMIAAAQEKLRDRLADDEIAQLTFTVEDNERMKIVGPPDILAKLQISDNTSSDHQSQAGPT